MKRIKEIKSLIRDIPDFPKPGIIFRDITSLLNSENGISLLINELNNSINYELDFNKIVAIESRGFIIGSLLATQKIRPLVLARKPGKLPNEVLQKNYSLEYGENSICIQKSDIKKGDKIIIIDDVLATSNTLKTTCEIVKTLGGIISCCYCLIELKYLNGREKLENIGIQVISSIIYN